MFSKPYRVPTRTIPAEGCIALAAAKPTPAFVLQVLRLYYKKSTFQLRQLLASAAYYVCTTKSRLSSYGSSGRPRRSTFVLQKADFPATAAPGVRGVLRLYYKYYVCTTKSRLSSYGSSWRPRRTTFVLQKVDFPATAAPGVRGVLHLYYKKSTFQLRQLLASAAYYVCTTKSRLSSYGSFGRPRRTTFVLQKVEAAPGIRQEERKR